MTPNGTHQGRSGADTVLIGALAAGSTAAEAARSAGISLRTVRRRLSDPAFVGQIDEAKADLLGQVLDRISGAAVAAVETLMNLMDPSTPSATRLGAARAVLDCSVRLRGERDLQRHLAEMELKASPPSPSVPTEDVFKEIEVIRRQKEMTMTAADALDAARNHETQAARVSTTCGREIDSAMALPLG